jgi:hypothetical protein
VRNVPRVFFSSSPRRQIADGQIHATIDQAAGMVSFKDSADTVRLGRSLVMAPIVVCN